MKEDGCSDRQCNRTDYAVGKMVLGMPSRGGIQQPAPMAGTLPPLVATGRTSRKPPGWCVMDEEGSHFSRRCHGQMSDSLRLLQL